MSFRLGRLILLVFAMQAFLMPYASGTSKIAFTGRAFDPASDKLLYTEQYVVSVNNTGRYEEATVTYVDPKGKVFAEKKLRYGEVEISPELEFEDHREKSKLKVSFTSPDQLILATTIGGKTDTKKVGKDKKLPSVVDAGFDRFVLENWGDLLNRKRVPFEFLALTRGELMDFTIALEKQTEKTVVFAIKPNNWLVGLLLDPILLTYDKDNRLLLEFKGVTNIERWTKEGSSTGENHIAVIRYEYHEPPRP